MVRTNGDTITLHERERERRWGRESEGENARGSERDTLTVSISVTGNILRVDSRLSEIKSKK